VQSVVRPVAVSYSTRSWKNRQSRSPPLIAMWEASHHGFHSWDVVAGRRSRRYQNRIFIIVIRMRGSRAPLTLPNPFLLLMAPLTSAMLV